MTQGTYRSRPEQHPGAKLRNRNKRARKTVKLLEEIRDLLKQLVERR